jgi:Ca-activated chloride channel family protein
MINNQALEVILDTRKPVLAAHTGKTLDILLRLRAHSENTDAVRTPLALSLVIDRSGSMTGRKLREAKRCVLDLVRRLHDDDCFSVTAYDQVPQEIMSLVRVREARPLLQQALSEIEAGGSTALFDGWLMGAKSLEDQDLLEINPLTQNALKRVILLTDGQANVGLMAIEPICEQVKEYAKRGISTTTVGFGIDFNEELLTAMANSGQGNAWYGERVEDLAESFDAEMSYLSNVLWKDVRVALVTPLSNALEEVKVRNDYAQTGRREWSLPGIAANSEVWMAISLEMNRVIQMQTTDTVLTCQIRAKNKDGLEHEFSISLPKLPVVEMAEYRAAPENELVARRFNEVESADIQRQARAYVQDRNWTAVERLINQLQERATDNPWLMETVSYLRKLLEQRDHVMMGKELAYASQSLRNRASSLSETAFYSASQESFKPAYLRRKVVKGRNSESQS